MAAVIREQWIMKFNWSSTAHSGGVGIVLYHKKDEAILKRMRLISLG